MSARALPLVFWLALLILLPACGGDAERAGTSSPGPLVQPPAPTPQLPSPTEPRLVARVPVVGDGFVRILPRFFLELGVPPSHISVRRGGRSVPVVAQPANDGLTFLAFETVGPDTNRRVYELVRHPAPVERPAAAAAASIREANELRAVRDGPTDRIFGDLPAGRPEVYEAPKPLWFVTRIAPGSGASLPLDPAGAAPGTAQEIVAHVFATRLGSVALNATWGGVDLGTARATEAFDGAALRWQVPADAVPGEETLLVLHDVSPPAAPPPARDVSEGRGTIWVSRLTLSGATVAVIDERLRSYLAEGRSSVRFAVPRHHADTSEIFGLSHGSFTALVGPDGEPLGTARIASVAGDTATLAIGDVPDGTRLFVSQRARNLTPERVASVPDPVAACRAARHVIVAVPDLLAEARRLAAHRTATGTPSAAIAVTDVYERYGGGEHTWKAIEAFLRDRMGRGGAPLDYVLLVGDATYDRTDLAPFVTIPAPMTRTMYNGATAADRLYVLAGEDVQGHTPAIGRLPFREAEPLRAYVDRLIRYETAPPPDPTRRMLRFVTSEGRFGPVVDRLIESLFRRILSEELPPAYDIQVTFASATSPFLWPPPEFGSKVIELLNEGSLFYTYVGHGFAQGFDWLRVGEVRFPILHIHDVDRVDVVGTPPGLFVLACTTAMFDHPRVQGLGEALLRRPHGPIAYWGATRICHPAANGVLGRAIARFMTEEDGTLRLGDILERANQDVLHPDPKDQRHLLIRAGVQSVMTTDRNEPFPMDRIAREGTWMYALLGDPALKPAFPRASLTVAAKADGGEVVVDVSAGLPDGTTLHVALERPRHENVATPEPVSDPRDPTSFPTIRRNHTRMNDWSLERTTATLRGGKARTTLTLPEKSAGLIVKVWALAEGDVHQGAFVLD